ncbi:MAG: hypothetical protein IT168_04985 [Bryobacterales bacterium]|nr:hypothetical protein [Bryobacterales bacterium]
MKIICAGLNFLHFLVIIFTSLGMSAVAREIPQSFIDCIGPNGSAWTCTLDPSPGDPYAVRQMLVIQRSNVRIQGLWVTSRGDVTLQRASTAFKPMLTVAPGICCVTIAELTFDGNKNFVNGQQPPGGGLWIDVDLGALSSSLINADFRNAPGFALTTGSSGCQVNLSNFYYGKESAIYAVRSEIYNSWFEGFGVGAINADQSTIRYNTFRSNHALFNYNTSGGQAVFMERTSSNVTVATNQIDGGYIANGQWWTGGIEVYGANHRIWNNEVKNHVGPGIYASGTTDLDIRGYDSACPTCPTYDITNNQRGGINVSTLAGFPFNQTRRTSIDGVRARSNLNYGIHISNDYGTNDTVTVTNNNLCTNNPSGLRIEPQVTNVAQGNNSCP